jgi:hypothetical protein
MREGAFYIMFTPTLDGALKRASTIEALHQHTQTNDALPRRAVALAGILLDEGRLYSKTINAELLKRTERAWSERKLQRAFGDLAEQRYGIRKPGAYIPGNPRMLPPLWTWHTDMLNLEKCHPLITIEFSPTDIAVVDTETGEIMNATQHTQPRALGRAVNGTFWDALHDKIPHMSNGELGEMRYNAIEMQRRDVTHAKFWRIQEYIYAGALADRGILQPAVILRRLRGFPN